MHVQCIKCIQDWSCTFIGLLTETESIKSPNDVIGYPLSVLCYFSLWNWIREKCCENYILSGCWHQFSNHIRLVTTNSQYLMDVFIWVNLFKALALCSISYAKSVGAIDCYWSGKVISVCFPLEVSHFKIIYLSPAAPSMKKKIIREWPTKYEEHISSWDELCSQGVCAK